MSSRALARALAVLVSAQLGCEVSVFGSEPIQLAGGPHPTVGGEAGACGEPEETRTARERLADGEPSSGESSPCAYHCVIAGGALSAESAATCPLVTHGEDGVFVIDMTRADALVARIEVCDASTFQLADSAGARHDGADDPASGHDASVVVHGGDLDLLPAHDGGLSFSHVTGYLPETTGGPSECATRTLELTDSVVFLHDLERGLCGTSMLRIDPPTDAQGSPDSRWHLVLGRTLDGARAGEAPPSVDLCFL